EGVGQHAGEKSHHDVRQRLEKAGEAELKRRAGEMVDLIEVRDVADLHADRRQYARTPDEREIADEKRGPRPNDLIAGSLCCVARFLHWPASKYGNDARRSRAS